MEISKPRIFLRSLLLAYGLSAVLLLVLAFLLYQFRLKENQVTLAVHLVYVLSCALAGFLSGKGIRRGRFFCGLSAGLLYFLILLLASLAFNHGSMPQLSRLFATLAFCAGSGIIGGVLS